MSCAPLAKVSERRAVLKLHSPITTPLIQAKQYVSIGQRLTADQPNKALGYFLESSRQSADAIQRDMDDHAAQDIYNFSVGRVVELLDQMDHPIWESPLVIVGPERTYTLNYQSSHQLRHFGGYHPQGYRVIPTDTLRVGGKFFQTTSEQHGIGSSLVAISQDDDPEIASNFFENRIYGSLTAVIRFQENTATLIAFEPLIQDEFTLHGKTYPLSADFSAPMSLLMAENRPEKLGFVRMIKPEKYDDTAALTLLQRYEPSKIPVVFVHGLDSTPATWIPVINELRNNAEFRERFQVWVFSYPSGYPYPYSASLLRREMDRMGQTYPGHKPVVLVGHSMGGLLSRILMSDSGNALWEEIIGDSPMDLTALSESQRAVLENSLRFQPHAKVARGIFICTPHQGSEIATRPIGRLASKMIDPPQFLQEIYGTLLSPLNQDEAGTLMAKIPNSIDSLSPDSQFVKVIHQLPIDSRIPYHSIIGDRGKGNSPQSSDGVVAYWSSHLPGARTEKIVPHNHSAHRSPEAISELLSILQEHARTQR